MAKPIIVNLHGEDRTLCYNITANVIISEIYGTTEQALEILSGNGTESELFVSAANWLYALVEGGKRYNTAMGISEEYSVDYRSGETFLALYDPFELEEMSTAIVAAINAGKKTEVKASAKKKKV